MGTPGDFAGVLLRVLNKPSQDKLKPRLIKPGFSAACLGLVLLKTKPLDKPLGLLD
jgi:hypothetical protein